MNYLFQLKIKEKEQAQFVERLKEIKDTKSVEFKATNERLIELTKEVDSLTALVQQEQNKRTNAHLNHAQEHVISEFIHAKHPLYNINSI